MKRGVRLGLFGLAAAVAAIGAAGLAGAQQGGVVAPGAPPRTAQVKVTPPKAAATRLAVPETGEEPPPGESALKGAVIPNDQSSEAADVQPDETASSAVSKPAPQKPVEPMKRPRYAIAVLQAMDKVTAETIRFEAPVDKPIRYKSLVFIVRACETTAPDEAISDAAAHVEIDSAPAPQQGAGAAPVRQLFRGWMFANSPGLNLFQNPAYDAWLIACKTASPAA
ncbi:MAG: DUF2155 domain-containing protein [Caulobacteraceae bacterium]|nr:DUF2155 domain-containing protein [Caulobacteraceae bacterium]